MMTHFLLGIIFAASIVIICFLCWFCVILIQLFNPTIDVVKKTKGFKILFCYNKCGCKSNRIYRILKK